MLREVRDQNAEQIIFEITIYTYACICIYIYIHIFIQLNSTAHWTLKENEIVSRFISAPVECSSNLRKIKDTNL